MSSAPFLSLPYKLTEQVDLVAAIRNYADHAFTTNSDPESHPDSLTPDARKLQQLREEATFTPASRPGSAIDSGVDALSKLVLYNAQLVYLLTKLPSDLAVEFPWYPLFSEAPAQSSAARDAYLPGGLGPQPPIERSDIQYERCNILMNIAAIYSRLAGMEDRSQAEGMKRAIAHYQTCAGILTYIKDACVPSIANSPTDPDPSSPELSLSSLNALINVALAQAQECIFQKALTDHLKNGSIARVAHGVSNLYEEALRNMNEARGGQGVWPTWGFGNDWVNHVTYKRWHFAAVAQYRKSCDDLAANRYGDELGRLHLAQKYVKTGLDTSKKGVSQQVVIDSKSLQAMLTQLIQRAEKDNSLIYLQAVTSETSLPSLSSPPMTRPIIPQEIEYPLPRLHASKGGLGSRPFFENLLPYAVQLAIMLYDDRKEMYVREEIQSRKEELDNTSTSTLQALNLPGSLQALEIPLGLPPSLLRRAEELRREGGTKRLRTMMQDALSVAATDKKVLDDVTELLNLEENEDASLRSHFGSEHWARPTSSELNTQLKDKIVRFKDTLEKAGDSDQVVREKYNEWEGTLKLLEGSQDALGASVPSASRKHADYDEITSPSSQTAIVRELRHMLEDIDDLSAARRRTLDEAKRLSQDDDIRSSILSKANELQSSSSKLETAQFEDLFTKELSKYTYYKDTLLGNERKQANLLNSITAKNAEFLNSRKTDPTIKKREEALQNFDVAFSKQQEIVVNLTEALQFYQDFAKLLDQLRATVREWVHARRAEAQALSTQLNMEAMSLQQQQQRSPPSTSPATSPSNIAKQAGTPSTRRQQQLRPAGQTPSLAPVNQPGTPRALRAQQPGRWDPSQPIKFG